MTSTSDKLFLLEFVVDAIELGSLPTGVLKKDETCITFQFLNNPIVEVSEEDFAPKQSNNKGGKSCLFALTPEMIEMALCEFQVNVFIIKKNKTGVRKTLGYSTIALTSLFCKTMQCLTDDADMPVSKSMKESFTFVDQFGDETGRMAIYLRLSCFGKVIVTQFQLGAKSAFFKGDDSTTVYQCKKLHKDPEVKVLPSLAAQERLEAYGSGIDVKQYGYLRNLTGLDEKLKRERGDTEHLLGNTDPKYIRPQVTKLIDSSLQQSTDGMGQCMTATPGRSFGLNYQLDYNCDEPASKSQNSSSKAPVAKPINNESHASPYPEIGAEINGSELTIRVHKINTANRPEQLKKKAPADGNGDLGKLQRVDEQELLLDNNSKSKKKSNVPNSTNIKPTTGSNNSAIQTPSSAETVTQEKLQDKIRCAHRISQLKKSIELETKPAKDQKDVEPKKYDTRETQYEEKDINKASKKTFFYLPKMKTTVLEDDVTKKTKEKTRSKSKTRFKFKRDELRDKRRTDFSFRRHQKSSIIYDIV